MKDMPVISKPSGWLHAAGQQTSRCLLTHQQQEGEELPPPAVHRLSRTHGDAQVADTHHISLLLVTSH